jgi:endonuclease YncB( thermonuclease family)
VLLAGALLSGCGGGGGAASEPADPAPGLLRAAPGGDGDSWRDTQGREYRLGLVDAPEVGDCFGDEATRRRQELVADGFRAEVYTTDRYGRSVAEVTAADGNDVAVTLAREGLVTDRYLARRRDEAPELAARLERAFAQARKDGAGLWRLCPRAGEQTGQPVEPPD